MACQAILGGLALLDVVAVGAGFMRGPYKDALLEDMTLFAFKFNQRSMLEVVETKGILDPASVDKG